MAIEYWCGYEKHWVDEVRSFWPTNPPCCKACTSGDWDSFKPVSREVKAARYVVGRLHSGLWLIADTEGGAVDYNLTESQAIEIAALRNKWEEGEK